MNKGIMDREPTSLDHVNLSKPQKYRGFRIKNQYRKTEYSIEVTGFNVNGHRLIGSGNTLNEAYENLIDRIDMTLDD